ncbi:hypothetical protein Snoj_00330 [Streptomyces nojiriensis]|uniref:Uncharacterized protein n=1 Tax=Streptomyces nojiriensis TaxID=66374 RepID=A0ABQ3SDC1_9ACTN|nr:hypothetical protein GCM10010205_81940 [Streptomyces nojiriensis]GHI66115.1 hypothetical protein Snoj_00330 [Streptomyces nojiriensis]
MLTKWTTPALVPTNGENGLHLAKWADRMRLLVMGQRSHARRRGRRPAPRPAGRGIDAAIAAALASGDLDGFFPDLAAGLARELVGAAARPGSCWTGPTRVCFDHRLLCAGDRGQRQLLRGDLVLGRVRNVSRGAIVAGRRG